MADKFYSSFNIGNNISKENFYSIIAVLNETCEENNYFDIEDCLSDGFINASGWMTFEDYQEIISKLQKLNLTYIATIDPKDEYEGFTTYSIPPHVGNIQSDMNRHPVIRISEIRPYVDLLMDLIKNGTQCLPLYINNDIVSETVKEMMAKPDKALEILQSLIDHNVPKIPTLPKLNILEN